MRVVRAGSPRPEGVPYVYIGRPSQWGNPWRITRHHTRAQVIEYFRVWWYDPMNAPMRQHALEVIPPGALLGCYCHPLPCHGDVIADFLNRERHAGH